MRIPFTLVLISISVSPISVSSLVSSHQPAYQNSVGAGDVPKKAVDGNHNQNYGQNKLVITCDNKMILYIDGILQILPSSETNYWTVASSVLLPDHFKVIAIECVDTGVIPGILASVQKSNGEELVTDSSWTCSAVYEEGWQRKEFVDDSENWKSATEIAEHGDRPWSIIYPISRDAKWIWTKKGRSSQNDPHVFCRMSSNPPTPEPTPAPTEEDEDRTSDEDDKEGACIDKLTTCPIHAKQGSCSDPTVLSNCQMSCKQCICGDNYLYCEDWAEQGLCTLNAPFMSQHCRQACGQCECSDNQVACYRWAAAGHCINDPGYMLANCPLSCNQCQCGDNSPDCVSRALTGQCSANSEHMMTHCAQSCNQCGSCGDNPPFVESCPVLTASGMCQDPTHAGFMMINCPMSCGFCKDGEDEEGDEGDVSDDEEVPWGSINYWMFPKHHANDIS